MEWLYRLLPWSGPVSAPPHWLRSPFPCRRRSHSLSKQLRADPAQQPYGLDLRRIAGKPVAKPETGIPDSPGTPPPLSRERPPPKPVGIVARMAGQKEGGFGLGRAPQASADELACRQRLAELSVAFTPLPQIDDGGGCGVAAPVRVTTLGPGVRLEPPATLNCRMAQQLARWVAEAVQPAARRLLGGAQVVAVRHASAYVCRTRNGRPGARLSEHAKANALDIGYLDFAGGATMQISLAPGGRAASAFQSEIRARACRFFKTVLGPGTDEAHAHSISTSISLPDSMAVAIAGDRRAGQASQWMRLIDNDVLGATSRAWRPGHGVLDMTSWPGGSDEGGNR